MRKNKWTLLAAVLLVMGLCLCGCGVNRKSPEGVVRSLIEACAAGKTAKAMECYGLEEDGDKTTKEDIEATIAYFKAHDAKKIELQDCGVISEFDGKSFVYATYQFQLEKDRNYPAVSTYLVGEKDKKYYVLPAGGIDDAAREKAAEAYQDFMESDAYKEYTKQYDAFMTKYPGYEEKIAAKLEK